MTTSKNLIPFLLAFYFISCQPDDIKNTYTIKGDFGRQDDGVIDDPGWPFFPEIKLITEVKLISGDQIIASSTDEEFEFTNLEEGKSYMVIPQSVSNGLYGTTALDFVILRKFTEGIDELTEFGKLAADVNKDNMIDQKDLDLIMNCLLTKECPESFRFITDDFDGHGEGYIDQFPVINLRSNVTLHLKPISMGDVNRSY